MFWGSILEMQAFLAGMVFFFVDASEMARVWWFLPHMVKGTLGLLILKNIPKTHDIIRNAHIKPNEKLSIEDTFENLT